MNAIMGMLQIIMIRNAPDHIKGYLETIDNESRNLLELIDNVLDVSDMEYEFFTLAEKPFIWRTLVNDVLAEAGRNATVKNQTLDCDIDPSIPSAFIGDETRLKQVLSNLLSNAVKYTHDHGTVRFSTRVLNDDSVTVTLEIIVSDNGVGISDEQQSHLFDLFEQVDGGLTRKQGGIGIGLVLSKRIIELMGGTMDVESELDKGTKFTLTCKLFKA
jgi:signal transduction histidine kinase